MGRQQSVPCRSVDTHMGLDGGDGAHLEKSPGAGRELQTLPVGFCHEGPPVNALCPHPSTACPTWTPWQCALIHGG